MLTPRIDMMTRISVDAKAIANEINKTGV